nr:SpoIVB peptidase [Thalassobacillus sp. CUG 92003]
MTKYIVGSVLLLLISLLPLFTPVQHYLSIPTHVKVFSSEAGSALPVFSDTSQKEENTIPAVSSLGSSTLQDKTSMYYELAGLPIKKVDVTPLKDIRLVPGGQSVGVKLHTLGMLVVGHHLVKSGETKASPGEEAGIQVGDIILEVNGKPLKAMKDLTPLVSESGENNEPLTFKIKRKQQTYEKTVTPGFDDKEKEYQLGLYIRDSAAGIGTMTFYHPDSQKYGALGHVISDMDTKQPIEIHDGTIVRSNVTSIEKGSQGIPGEKRADFSMNEDKIGNITKNSPFGIFGELEDKITNDLYEKPLSIAPAEQIKEGPAQILTVLDGEKVQPFDIEIITNMPKDSPVTKGMIIKITDPELLDKTGGIVQGMSGSPIIQNNKIVGAVTHVFVNDPTSGYGVHIEWMLKEAGIELSKQQQQKAS